MGLTPVIDRPLPFTFHRLPCRSHPGYRRRSHNAIYSSHTWWEKILERMSLGGCHYAAGFNSAPPFTRIVYSPGPPRAVLGSLKSVPGHLSVPGRTVSVPGRSRAIWV